VNELTTQPRPPATTSASGQAPALARLSRIPLKQCTNLEQAFGSFELRERIEQAIPKHMSPDRMLRTFVMAVQKAPLLAKADLRTFIGACLTLTAVGLEPNGPLGHAYLIPFKRRKWNPQTRARDIEEVEVQVIMGYQGLLDLAYRSPLVTSIQAHVVFDGDDFDYSYGTDPHLTHRPKGGEGKGKPPVAAYMAARLKDGFSFEVMDWADVLRIRNGSQAYQQALRAKEEAASQGRREPPAYSEAPWVRHWVAMARKTAFRSGSKWLPRSIELASVVTIDERQEQRRGIEWGRVLDANDGDYLAAATVAAEQPDEEAQAGPAPDAAFSARPQPVQSAQPQAPAWQDDGGPGPFGGDDDDGRWGPPQEGPAPAAQAAPQQAQQPAPAPQPQPAPQAAPAAPQAAAKPARQPRAAKEAAPPPPPADDAAWTVFDPHGEPADGFPPLTDRGDFASAYAAQWDLCATESQTQALAEHNADGLAWAREAAKAKKLLDALSLPTKLMQQRNPAPTQEPLDEAGTGDPTSNQAADHDPGPKAAPPPAGSDPDLEWATDLMGKLDGAPSADVHAWVQNGAIRARMSRLQRERPDLFGKVETAFRTRLARKD
jgi:recombination protein RecT